jgi:putative serine protease PepD
MSINSFSKPRRTAATLAAAVLLGGAGGAATTALIFEPSDRSSAPPAATSASAALPIADGDSSTSASAIYSKVKSGVVEITATKQQAAAQLGGQQGGTAQAGGSGFVVDDAGHIVTNQHVVDGANSIEVAFADGTKAKAKVVGQDASSDVAVIQVEGVDAANLHPLSWADSSKVQVGDSVVALGSPYGLEGTLTAGIVSALNRSIEAPNNYTITGAIQTDAPINHGNSGGPLLNSAGQVIGINSQIESDSGDNSGIGFAVASANAKRVADQIIAGKDVAHPYLGIQLSDAAEGGATVAAISDDSPAGDAGVKTGDTITAADGQGIDSADALVGLVQSHQPGDKLALTIRRGGDEKQVTVTLGNRAE